MPYHASRRKFIAQTALATLGAGFNLPALAGFVRAGVPGLQLGYSAITWGGNDAQAISDIAALGFTGIQLRSNTLKQYGTQPEALKALLQQHNLQLPMFSGGNANINTGNDAAVVDNLVEVARFVKALGGSNIQITNSSRPKTGDPTDEDLKNFAGLLNQIGKQTQAFGVQVNYHNHMGQLGQTPQEVDTILKATDAKYVKLLLDIAHYQQGGGDPAKAIRQYKDRLHALHLKDVTDDPAKANGYIFVELGQGRVDLPAVFKAMNDIRFKGWGIIELDAVPQKTKTPVECAAITKAYLKSIGIMA